MKLLISPKFRKDTQNLPVQVNQAIAAHLKQVQDAATPAEIPGLKKLKGHKHKYRIRVGHYRIGIHIEGDTAEAERFALRSKIYQIYP